MIITSGDRRLCPRTTIPAGDRKSQPGVQAGRGAPVLDSFQPEARGPVHRGQERRQGHARGSAWGLNGWFKMPGTDFEKQFARKDCEALAAIELPLKGATP